MLHLVFLFIVSCNKSLVKYKKKRANIFNQTKSKKNEQKIERERHIELKDQKNSSLIIFLGLIFVFINVRSMKLTVKLVLLVTLFCFGVHGIPTEPTKFAGKKSEHLEEDDSDMLMEPDEFRATALLPPHATAAYFQSGEIRSNEFRSGEYRSLTPEYVHLERPVAQRIRSIEDTRAPPPQNIFPPPFFRNVNVPPLGHSRPYFQSQENSGRFGGARSYDQSILGSGDFGVIKGGTFYQEGDDLPHRSSYENDEFLNYFNTNNGHGRPHTSFIPKTFFPDEQFSNFRDFADINTPTDPAYSQFVVVYANKNSTDSHPNPKNIIEQLQLLDKETSDEQRKEKKNSISKFKKKLANTKLEKKYKKTKFGVKDNNSDFEPLLALS